MSLGTAIYEYSLPGGGVESRYLFTDWGATMGKSGGFMSREKWDCDGYADQTPDFVEGVENGVVKWGFSGKRDEEVTWGITVADVEWPLQCPGRITDDQIGDGLEASGATPEEVECFAKAIRNRIEQLRNLSATGRR